MNIATKTENIALFSKVSSKPGSKKGLKNKSRSLSKNNKHQHVFTSQINYFKQGESERPRLESFIQGVYKKYYNTEINEFYPNLLAIESDGIVQKCSIKAVAGIRSAELETLFSEYYLSNKLEDELFRIYHKSITRKTIVEVGNLSPANIGQMRWLITSITAFLYSAGFKYIVFTGVPGISNAFKRMHIPIEIIAEAKRNCLPIDIRQKWGPEYYINKPMVFSGDIVKGFDIIKNSIYNSNKKLIPLFERACFLGKQISECPHNLTSEVA